MTALTRKEPLRSQYHLGLKDDYHYYTMREFTNADYALPEHDCFCALLIHSHYRRLVEDNPRDDYYAAMGYYFADEKKFYFGFCKTGISEEKPEYKYVADGRNSFDFEVHSKSHDYDSWSKEDWFEEELDVLAWCEVDELSALGEEE